ncbi:MULTISPECIES: SemiSWEET family sugar transporter [unclassified Leeuwenhoekiella]|uniref:SemiSWEET family sugar transporter n=1 Tax=unclassified Leeuwenhoekiella TaxID=2615029 RepID=UPI000C6C2F9E|nr:MULTISPECIES: SemiSWEET transporter [unclassified Leeuwenhoekiella]MAW96810.1 hypothetical protein [Leeuwenhoekiella sp.]MBA80307.1 hypothetical protein [Leeuwenhoekiella sp.]|tara:strand:- start:16825 stop:17100 length:276 start_codon:yes stop_codon:yes gene_type:complete
MFDFDFIEILGLVAAVLTTSAFAPQVYHTYKTKDVSGLSLPMYFIFLSGLLLWILYGVQTGSIAVIAANVVTSGLVIVLIVLKIKYGKTRS